MIRWSRCRLAGTDCMRPLNRPARSHRGHRMSDASILVFGHAVPASRTRTSICACFTVPAGLAGRSTRMLECVKILVMAISIVAGIAARADDAPRWAEYFKVFAAVQNETEASIIAEADAALAPVGFHRDSTGTTYPGNSLPVIFASYTTNDSARALILQASSPDCLVFSATNHDRSSPGLADRAGAAIEARFRAAFGPNVRFYSDAKCMLPL